MPHFVIGTLRMFREDTEFASEKRVFFKAI